MINPWFIIVHLMYRGERANHTMEKIQLYLKESYQELVKNVSWPTWANLQGNAVAVVIAVLMLATIVFLMDMISKFTLDLVYGI